MGDPISCDFQWNELSPLETWNTETLARLPADAIRNDFAYNTFKAGPYGIVAEVGAMATITLPPQPNVHRRLGGNSLLTLTDVNGRSFSLKLVSAREVPESRWPPPHFCQLTLKSKRRVGKRPVSRPYLRAPQTNLPASCA